MALVGGGTVPDAALGFLIDQAKGNRAKGGDFVILTYGSATAGPNSLAEDIWTRLGGQNKPNSLETIAIRSKDDASDPALVEAVKDAEAIFITGGDQSNYYDLWPGYPGGPNIRDAVNEALANGAAIGGTSAGMAILGPTAYDYEVKPPDGDNLYSSEALAQPAAPDVSGSLTTGFLRTDVPGLGDNIVTETHFQPGDRDPQGRMGRLITFLASMAAGRPVVSGIPHGIAASNSTAILIDQCGTAEVVADPNAPAPMAYFASAPDTVPLLGQPSDIHPLNWTGIEVTRVKAGGWFDLNNWEEIGQGFSREYQIDVINGRLAVEGNNDIY